MNTKHLKVHANKLDSAPLLSPFSKGGHYRFRLITIDTVPINQYPAQKPVLALYFILINLFIYSLRHTDDELGEPALNLLW